MTGASTATTQEPAIDDDEVAFSDDQPATTERLQRLLEADSAEWPVRISFRCFNIPFIGLIVGEGGEQKVKITGYVGALPYTAESVEAREIVTKILACEPRRTLGRLAIARRNLIEVQGEIPLSGQPTPTRVVAAATAVVACAKPLIDLMNDCLPPACQAQRAG